MDKYLSVQEIEEAALELLPKYIKDYYRSGATEEQTLFENKAAFKRLRIDTKSLMGVDQIDLKTNVLGETVAMPVGIAPTSMHRMAHPDGELATAKAAQAAGTVFTLSTAATSSIEDVALAAPDAVKWFQLYIFKDRNVTKDLVLRAEKAGFKAIVLTVDTPLVGLRRSDLRNQFTLPTNLRLANADGHMSSEIHNTSKGSGLNDYVNSLYDDNLTWDDITWLKSITKLPIVVKGILRADDAERAARAGCAALLVSNHGGRQLDGVPATVFVGRPALWGLAVGGQAGVQRMLSIIRTELEYAVQIAGTPTIADITKDMVRHHSAYSKL